MKIETLNQLKKIAKKVNPRLLPWIKKAILRGEKIHVFDSTVQAYKALNSSSQISPSHELPFPSITFEDMQVADKDVKRGFLAVFNISAAVRKYEREKHRVFDSGPVGIH
ncbi:MAG: hypothetical protein WC575_03395 [Patescibacteria group bacterium]